jgi:ABC-type amino acid transport substrate-binding protein
MTWTEERANNMRLSDKYLSVSVVLVVKSGVIFNPNSSTIAVENTSQAQRILQSDDFFTNKDNITAVAKMTNGFLEAKSGTVTATFCDKLAAMEILKSPEYSGLEIWNGYEKDAGQFDLGFRKNDTEFAGKVNAVMQEMKDDGRFLTLAQKYGIEELIK